MLTARKRKVLSHEEDDASFISMPMTAMSNAVIPSRDKKSARCNRRRACRARLHSRFRGGRDHDGHRHKAQGAMRGWASLAARPPLSLCCAASASPPHKQGGDDDMMMRRPGAGQRA